MNLSRIIGTLALVATVVNAVGLAISEQKPTWAIWLLATSGAISAFTARVQGVPEERD